MRYSRLLRWVVVVAVVALGLLVAADIVALQVAQSRASKGFAQATAAERATVSLGGFPFLPRLVTGRLARIGVKATGLSGGGLRVSRVEVSVDGARFAPSSAIALIRTPYAARAKLTTAAVVARAEITEFDLGAFLRSKFAELHDVRITPGGIEVRIVVKPETGELSAPIRFLPRMENRRLVLRQVGEAELPIQFRGTVHSSIEQSIDLPQVPDGLTVSPTLGDGSLALDAATPKLELLVGEGGIRSALDVRPASGLGGWA